MFSNEEIEKMRKAQGIAAPVNPFAEMFSKEIEQNKFAAKQLAESEIKIAACGV